MVGIKKHKKDNPKSEETQASPSTAPPKLARRKANRKSTMKLGRTIRGERERLETASERIAVHKKNKRQKTLRIAATIVGLTIAIIVIVWFISLFMPKDTKTDNSVTTITVSVPYTPTIEVVDEDASAIDKISVAHTREVYYLKGNELYYIYPTSTSLVPVLVSDDVDKIVKYIDNDGQVTIGFATTDFSQYILTTMGDYISK